MSLTYRSEIDGLRSIAVFSVVLYHAGFSYASGGFVGVDVFFVISGFLITSIIIQDLRNECFSIRHFYERRARRILPALLFVSVLCLVPAWLWMFPDEFAAFGHSLVSVATFSANIFFWLHSNYFSPSVRRLPLLHTWSLGIEEQYYLLVPLAISLLWRYGQRRLLLTIALTGVVSLALAEWGSRFYPSATFYLLHARVWELMIGSGLAVSISGPEIRSAESNWKASALSLSGLVLILYSIVAFDDKTTRFPGLMALLPTVGTMLVIRFGDRTTVTGRVLGLKPLVGIGLISYSLYLWHQPLFAFARIKSGQELTTASAVMLIVVALLLAFLTWRFIERPFRRKGFATGRFIWVGSLASMSALLVAGVLLSDKRVAQRHFTMKQQEVLAWEQYVQKVEVYRQGKCFLDPDQTFREFSDSCVSASGISAPGAIVVWGDSFAAAIHVGIFDFAADRVRAQFTASACPPLLDFNYPPRPNCPDINRFVLNKLREFPGANVFLDANWAGYAALPGFSQGLSNTLKALKDMGANPIVLGQTPIWSASVPTMLAQHLSADGLLPLTLFSNARPSLTAIDNRLAQTSEEAGVPFVRVLPLLCDSDGCNVISLVNGKATPLQWDTGHFTKEGSEMVGRLLFPVVKGLLRPQLRGAALH